MDGGRPGSDRAFGGENPPELAGENACEIDYQSPKHTAGVADGNRRAQRAEVETFKHDAACGGFDDALGDNDDKGGGASALKSFVRRRFHLVERRNSH